jgi:hypothetical protein
MKSDSYGIPRRQTSAGGMGPRVGGSETEDDGGSKDDSEESKSPFSMGVIFPLYGIGYYILIFIGGAEEEVTGMKRLKAKRQGPYICHTTDANG